MYIEDESGKQLEAHILKSIYRTALEPVPITFEAWIDLRSDIAAKLQEGATLKVGPDREKVIVVLAKNEASGLQGEEVQQTVRKITCLHHATHKVSFRREKAVIRENVTLAQVYQACGATAKVDADITIPKFYCYKGAVPSECISVICHEEGGVVYWDGKAVKFMRINALFSQKPTEVTGVSDLTLRSGFVERHEVPVYITASKSGAIVVGDSQKTRAVQFRPEKGDRQLHAMSHPILNAKDVSADFNSNANAGDVLEINQKKFVILTASHQWVSGDNGDNCVSRFWLGVQS